MGAMASQITGVSIIIIIIFIIIQPLVQAQIKERIKASRHWPFTCEFPGQRASNAENASIWWRYLDDHDISAQK